MNVNPTPDDITDEELAVIEKGHEEWGNLVAGHALCKVCWPAAWPCRTFRLIAALRTERAENERLRRITDAWGALEFSSRWAGPSGPA